MKNVSASTLLCAALGALVIGFAWYAGLWYVAQGMTWWTFSLTGVGSMFVWAIIKTACKSTRNRR